MALTDKFESLQPTKRVTSLFDEFKAFAFKGNVIDLAIGVILAEVLNFLIVAGVLFLFIKKFLGWLMKAKNEEAAVPAPTKEQVLLTEIRDLLKAGSGGTGKP
jgi:large conductance mechanosensitive channel